MFGLALALLVFVICAGFSATIKNYSGQEGVSFIDSAMLAVIIGTLSELGLRAAIQGCWWPSF